MEVDTRVGVQELKVIDGSERRGRREWRSIAVRNELSHRSR
jgi:hypothetical protein